MQETIEGDKTSREEMADIIRQQSVTITNLKKELETLSERNAKVDEQIQFVTNSLETAELQARHGQSEESTEDCVSILIYCKNVEINNIIFISKNKYQYK